MDNQRLTELNAKLDLILEIFMKDPEDNGVFLDEDSDPAGTRAYSLKMESAALALKTTEQIRKNTETATKNAVLRGEYIPKKTLMELVDKLYTLFISSIGYSQESDKQIEYIQNGITEILSELSN